MNATQIDNQKQEGTPERQRQYTYLKRFSKQLEIKGRFGTSPLTLTSIRFRADNSA
jgi:ethanolamine ammonia-lyase small subunit